MGRRDSTFLRGRASVFLTAETRGAPYKVISIALALGYVVFGIRNVFFCGAMLPVGDGEDLVMEMWQGCKEDKTMEVWEGTHGLGDLLIAIVRIGMAMTASTSNLYHTMLILSLYSWGFFTGGIRVGILNLPLYYSGFLFGSLLYENYILYLAYLAHRSRRHQRAGLEETNGIPGKLLFLVVSACWYMLALKFFVACDSDEGEFWSNTWKDCRNPDISPNIRIGWAHMAGVHYTIVASTRAYLYFTKSIDTFLNGIGLVLFYEFGCLFLILRAGVSDAMPFFPYISVLLLGLIYDSFAAATAYKVLKEKYE